MKLSEMAIGDKKQIFKLSESDPISKRLLDMGYREGLYVELVLLKGDIAEYKIGNTLLALKRSQCHKILVI